jgi:hypothetical protein
MAQAAAAARAGSAGARRYARHRPEQTLLYRIVAKHYPALVGRLAGPGRAGPCRTTCERRVIALPATTFSATAACMNPEGAITLTLPLSTSASSTTPRTPPKWSTCECE